MNRALFILIAVLPLVTGCESYKRITGDLDSGHAESAGLPDDYTVTGVTLVDRETIEPVRCLNSEIRVWVRTPGKTDFRELNDAEFSVYTTGPGGGGVRLKGEILIQSGKQYPQRRPAAPTGTEYLIRSVLVRS